MSSEAYSLQVTSSGHDLFKQEKQEHDGSQGVVVQAGHCTTPWSTIYIVIIDLNTYSDNLPENSNSVLNKGWLFLTFIKVIYILATGVTGWVALQQKSTKK